MRNKMGQMLDVRDRNIVEWRTAELLLVASTWFLLQVIKFLVWKIISYQRRVYINLFGWEVNLKFYFIFYETGLWACFFLFKWMINHQIDA